MQEILKQIRDNEQRIAELKKANDELRNKLTCTMWAARDNYGCLFLFHHRPKMDNDFGQWYDPDCEGYIESDAALFPDVTFEKSPVPLEIKQMKIG